MEHKLKDKLNPKDFEDKIYENWEKSGYFKPAENKGQETYCIMMPPPNVTGKLHMGHALDDTIQDILIRFKRMQGYRTLWLPGSDHAAISTEMKVVQKLKSKGISKNDLGREKFLEEAWNWTHEYGGIIQSQQRKLGCSCDWERNRFTLDEGMSDAVLEQFIKLYNKGLIYKGTRMVNWCTSCNTSISDAEVEYKEEPSHLWHIRYKITGTKDQYIEVATTRPETMLGDTAVAVHPDDERYKNLIGKTCILPIMNKEIPIIADEFVEKEFGTGCVKITPAHDMNDYQAGLRHNLEIIEVFDEHFKMGNLVPELAGMDLIEAREKIVEKLTQIGALVKTEDYVHNVAKCERCKNTIEPKVSEQWFVDMKELAKRAADSVRNGETKFVPQRYEKQYFNWLDNIQDWCISRQLWWGHRIPAYYCQDCNHINVSKTTPEKCEKCGSTNLEQDPDTLDTWFSSALWPFSTLGWPDKETQDYKDFYPTQTLVTGFDIITFWISRMMTQGLELTNQVPFKDVLVHGIVRDNQGRKMSKTLGNGVDPLDVIEQYGTDSLRMSLIIGTTPGNDIRYSNDKVESASNFANKLWNASKFVLMQLEDVEKFKEETIEQLDQSKMIDVDKWIISKLNTLIKEVTENIEKYDLGVALQKIYDFIRNDFCDWYIEIVKPRLWDKENKSRYTVQYILNYVLCTSLKLLHPFMPFITEEIYSKMYHKEESIMISEFPKYNEKLNFLKEEEATSEIMNIITEIRNIRSKMNVHPSKKSKLIFVTTVAKEEIEKSKDFLEKLGFANQIEIRENAEGIPENAVAIISKNMEVHIPFEELVDIEEERKRLETEKKRLESEVARGEKMLSNPGFVNKAPESKINEEKSKLANYKELLENIIQKLEKM
ncbi:MAG: valine--tRNA ligase [Clostridia bacterium]|nr:valine--tRNA ligase [Clostridia bacterium]